MPNLQVYVPARPVLLGQVPEIATWSLVGRGALQALAYSAVMLALAAIIFEARLRVEGAPGLTDAHAS